MGWRIIETLLWWMNNIHWIYSFALNALWESFNGRCNICIFNFILSASKYFRKWKWTYKPDICIKNGEIFFFFRLWMQFSPTRGCFSQMFKKQISKHSSNQIFWHQFCLWKTPSSRFLFFSPLCMPIFFKTFHLPIFGELRKLHAKNFMFSVKIGGEIIFQSWLLLHPCYNFAIVHCIALVDNPMWCVGGNKPGSICNICNLHIWAHCNVCSGLSRLWGISLGALRLSQHPYSVTPPHLWEIITLQVGLKWFVEFDITCTTLG